MQIRLPARYSDLTLRELKALMTSTDPIERVSACCALTDEELRKLPKKAITEGNKHLNQVLAKEETRLDNIVELNGKSYGFIPDWEMFTLGEWIDMDSYIKEFWVNIDKIMGILYRPIKRSFKDKYEIDSYTAKEDLTDIQELPAYCVTGALLFFLTTDQTHRKDLEVSLIQVVKATSLQKSGDGTQ